MLNKSVLLNRIENVVKSALNESLFDDEDFGLDDSSVIASSINPTMEMIDMRTRMVFGNPDDIIDFDKVVRLIDYHNEIKRPVYLIETHDELVGFNFMSLDNGHMVFDAPLKSHGTNVCYGVVWVQRLKDGKYNYVDIADMSLVSDVWFDDVNGGGISKDGRIRCIADGEEFEITL